MKKLVAACFACLLLTFAAGAANVGTIDNGYPGDTGAQAQMLCDLGLFQGTEKGFELEKPLTRAEAAAMLTRLLGAEEAALSGDWVHPFTDVPAWADKYVGWLYGNGLTKGTSDTTYGAAENVTCGQYCTFLARASTDYDFYAWLLRLNEQEQCDAAGFVRGDAVSLSTRLLGELYRKNGDESGLSVAQALIAKGVFTTGQWGTATRHVLPSYYCIDGEGADTQVQRTVAGVVVASGPVGQRAVLCTPDRQQEPVYLVTGSNGQPRTLYRVDPDTMGLTQIYACDADHTIYPLCWVGNAHYFYLNEWENLQSPMTVLLVQGDAAQLTGITLTGDWELQPHESGQLLLGETGWLLTGDGVQPQQMRGTVFATLADGRTVTQSIDAEQTLIMTWTASGAPLNTIAIRNSLLAYPTDDARVAFAPQLSMHNDVYFWGSAGLYRMDNDGLTQITALPAYDYTRDPSDGSFVIVTHNTNRFVTRSDNAVTRRAGDTLSRILPDGTEERLLPQLPEGSLLLGTVNLLPDGRIEFTTLKSTEPRKLGEFTCVLDDGKVTVTDATDDIFYMWGEEAVEAEQARLDALGIGSGAA